MKLAEIALECDKSISWVFARLDGKYSPGKKSEEKVEVDAESTSAETFDKTPEEELAEIDAELEKIRERQEQLSKELGHSPFRTDEELVEYREKRDAEVKNPD